MDYGVWAFLQCLWCYKPYFALLLHTGGRSIQDILSKYSEETRGKEDEYNTTAQCVQNHFKEKKNVTKARQNFMSMSPQ